MNRKIEATERKILQHLDTVLKQESVRHRIDSIVVELAGRLDHDKEADMTWESLPLVHYNQPLPEIICSSWVFVIRSRTNTGAERHPNSHQRLISYQGSGDIQVWSDENWTSYSLAENPDADISERWVSIPPNVWHQAAVSEENWAVVSFHTVPEDALIEERPDPSETDLTCLRRYVNQSFNAQPKQERRA